MDKLEEMKFLDWIESIRTHPNVLESTDAATNYYANKFAPVVTAIIAKKIPRKLKSIVEAWGIANESFVEVQKSIANNLGKTNWTQDEFFRLYITIASDNVLDEKASVTCRKNGGDSATIHVDDLNTLIVDRHRETCPCDVCEWNEELEACLRSLPSDLHRKIWTMKLDEKSTAGIAEKVGIKQQSVNQKMRQTRHLFKRLLDLRT